MIDINAFTTAWKKVREQLDRIKNIDATEEQIKLKNLVLEGLSREAELKEEILRLQKKIDLFKKKQNLTFDKEKTVYEGKDGNHYCPRCFNEDNGSIVPLGQDRFDQPESWKCSKCDKSYYSVRALKSMYNAGRSYE